MPEPVVVDRVTKRFSGHTAVDSLSLTVPAGTIYGLLGPNGAGKSTTIRMIMDIYEPDSGEVQLFRANWLSAGGARALSEDARARRPCISCRGEGCRAAGRARQGAGMAGPPRTVRLAAPQSVGSVEG